MCCSPWELWGNELLLPGLPGFCDMFSRSFHNRGKLKGDQSNLTKGYGFLGCFFSAKSVTDIIFEVILHAPLDIPTMFWTVGDWCKVHSGSPLITRSTDGLIVTLVATPREERSWNRSSRKGRPSRNSLYFCQHVVSFCCSLLSSLLTKSGQ